ncbi:MAG: reverse transcriptase N-terminal domain-containing protein [Stigonema ocellatum SAG 48.90 = DSM 106950]|nr:reverse transcriptase N-terminal domain-containing protein [Stigonema ocellatum SAG 48.90 = DSM 106950]
MIWNVKLPVAIDMSKTSFKTTVEWKTIPWRKLERKVFKLQKRIYRASCRGDLKAVRRLQKTLMRSWSAKCIAVRRVTQDNQGVRRESCTLGASAPSKLESHLSRRILSFRPHIKGWFHPAYNKVK